MYIIMSTKKELSMHNKQCTSSYTIILQYSYIVSYDTSTASVQYFY